MTQPMTIEELLRRLDHITSNLSDTAVQGVVAKALNIKLLALNAELLAALIPLEKWAQHFANILGTTNDNGVTITPHLALNVDAERARAVIAKAKELDQ